MRILTHAPELVGPSDRAQTQRPRRKSAMRTRPAPPRPLRCRPQPTDSRAFPGRRPGSGPAPQLPPSPVDAPRRRPDLELGVELPWAAKNGELPPRGGYCHVYPPSSLPRTCLASPCALTSVPAPLLGVAPQLENWEKQRESGTPAPLSGCPPRRPYTRCAGAAHPLLRRRRPPHRSTPPPCRPAQARTQARCLVRSRAVATATTEAARPRSTRR